MKETKKFYVYVSVQAFPEIQRRKLDPDQNVNHYALLREACQDVAQCGLDSQGETRSWGVLIDGTSQGVLLKVPHYGMTWPFYVLASKRSLPQFAKFLRGQPPQRAPTSRGLPTLGERLVVFLREHSPRQFTLKELTSTRKFGTSENSGANIYAWLKDEVKAGRVQRNETCRGIEGRYWVEEVPMP